jgi:hypothetical protein
LIVAAAIASDGAHVWRLTGEAQLQLLRLGEGYEEPIVALNIVVSTALAGHIYVAKMIAQEIEDAGWRLRSLLEAARAVASAGNISGAEWLLKEVKLHCSVPAVAAELPRLLLVQAVIACGDYGKAEQLYREFANGSPQIEANAELAIDLFANYDHAVELAREADREDPLNCARKAVAVRLAAAGEHSRAEQLAREIESSWARSVALVGLAELMDDDAARRLVIEVLTSEAWRHAVPLAARLIGPKVVEIAEYLLD